MIQPSRRLLCRRNNIFILLFSSVFFNHVHAQQLIKYVDPFIGTGGHGHTYPGATVPFGMVQLSPDNGQNGWDWCSGYHYSSDSIAGFSHMHLSGTGIGDWCDISVMPAIKMQPAGKSYKERFSHSNEKASPGFYGLKLDNGIQASFTATERCGLHQYIFPQGSNPVIHVDLGFHINWDAPTETLYSSLMILRSLDTVIPKAGPMYNVFILHCGRRCILLLCNSVITEQSIRQKK